MSRAAAVALASSLAVAGCSSSEVAIYGAPAPPADAGDAGVDGAPTDGGPATLYGGPPVDAGADTGEEDTGAPMNLYGAPPPDAGT